MPLNFIAWLYKYARISPRRAVLSLSLLILGQVGPYPVFRERNVPGMTDFRIGARLFTVLEFSSVARTVVLAGIAVYDKWTVKMAAGEL